MAPRTRLRSGNPEDASDTLLEPNYDDKSNKKRVTGPASYAIDDNEDTGWGIDAGPGRRQSEQQEPSQGATIASTPLSGLSPDASYPGAPGS